MRRPRPIFRRRGKLPPPKTPTTDDLLALLGADWHALKARRGFADRVVLAVRRIPFDPAERPRRGRPRRVRSGVLVGAASAFLLAFAAGLIEAGRGGVRSAADTPSAQGPLTRAADDPRGVASPAGLKDPGGTPALPGPDPDAPHPLDDGCAAPSVHRKAHPARPAGGGPP